MEASVGEHFRGNRCINCMCHSSENLYHYRETSLLRAADDFYPDEPAAQPVHLAHVSYNSLFLGEIGHVDWDMFTSTHSDAHMHAAARAVGGCPIYVSDQPGEHDFDLLRTLVLPDGTALLARHAGRPTRDVLFSDVNADGVSALKIWNENACTGVVGAFNEGEDGARGGGGSSPAAPPPAEYALYTHRAEGLRVLGAEDAVEVRLAAREWEIVVVAPVRAEGEVRWAPLGLLDMLNGGGAVLSSSLALSSPPGEAAATAVVRAAGRIGAFARPAPLEVCVDGSPVRFEYDEGSGLLTVNVAADGAEVEPLELRARWGPPAEEEEEEQQS
ncbi:hypothetical protein EMIHUDRAFT_249968 [Emiliania huxleyi CCMP1516]|uniref:Uncharacterized protein n=2 Tax=Emiliania huxleyi TaxID=2903 RepID=A0A0D3I4R6_EMIH1|nr:hypothetical protein EMIHUDRAFT_249968 [Emiliania huxleyi CCMP1516]EOD06251.1 hypothetical protein EMIHUDRAFT_249968 [Emiliania huxleyi CCMP1516]|eukprot:XP_005758680.1 hypothetical protein EMIHUDRAFT_249968 [Emiliania huxleyi CCMP1516]